MPNNCTKANTGELAEALGGKVLGMRGICGVLMARGELYMLNVIFSMTAMEIARCISSTSGSTAPSMKRNRVLNEIWSDFHVKSLQARGCMMLEETAVKSSLNAKICMS